MKTMRIKRRMTPTPMLPLEPSSEIGALRTFRGREGEGSYTPKGMTVGGYLRGFWYKIVE